MEWSRIAEHESWRKELHRPATYVHKWWARRLGSVARHLLLAAVSGPDDSIADVSDRLRGLVVYDPFAGSGTTLVEAAKLGAAAVGRDINPVATLTQRQALQPWDIEVLADLFGQVVRKCARPVQELHRTVSDEPVLHYFWVALAHCPECGEDVELFTTRVFARHAYPRRFPRAQAVCPGCRGICVTDLSKDERGHCPACGLTFSFQGATRGRFMTCRVGHRTPVIAALNGAVPERRMYAKLVLRADGKREYRAIDDFDLYLYDKAAKSLANTSPDELVRPLGTLEEGVSTVQALRWGYNSWEQFFNERQRYSLGLIGATLRDLPGASAEREALIASFGRRRTPQPLLLLQGGGHRPGPLDLPQPRTATGAVQHRRRPLGRPGGIGRVLRSAHPAAQSGSVQEDPAGLQDRGRPDTLRRSVLATHCPPPEHDVAAVRTGSRNGLHHHRRCLADRSA